MTGAVSVLVVDDDIDQAQSLSTLLEHKGYAVTQAFSGLEAFEKVAETPFNIAFLDTGMLSVGGFEINCMIRGIRPGTHIVVMVASAIDDQTRQRAILGAYEVMTRPLDINQVIAAVEATRKPQLSW